MRVVHIVAGSLAIITGYVAMYSRKGAVTHRKSGLLFVTAMLVMATTGGLIAAWGGNEGSAIGAAMTCYFVITALTTVRPPVGWTSRLELGLTLVALAVSLGSLALGFATLATPDHRWKGLPPFPFFMFGIVGLLATAGDIRILRTAPLRGGRRLARHLWRMCWAMWIATGSFFFGQAKVIPEPVRKPFLLALPVLAVFVTMFYWLWRVRVRRSLRGIVDGSAPEAVRMAPRTDLAVTVRS